jgi:hypothetical protein
VITPLEDSYDELILEAGPDPKEAKAYNTNLLIDHILPLTKVKDQEEIMRLRRPLPQRKKKVMAEPGRRPVPSVQAAPVKPVRLASGQPSGGEFLWNSSFEDVTKMAGVPSGWSNCGFPNESAPDVQPGSFQVVKQAKHGSTYLGMVVRDNESWESVGQQLDQPLLKGQSYLFKAFLTRSEIYMSISQTTREPANYTTPAKLRIWGGYEECGKVEMLAETEVITHIRWIEYQNILQPQQGDYPYILLEVFYETPTDEPYNGHILIDQCSLQKVKN